MEADHERWRGSKRARRPAVVVTRPRGKAGSLIEALEGHGCRVLHLPTIEMVVPSDSRPLRDRARRLDEYDWVVFTSVSGVRAVAMALRDESPQRALPERRESGDSGTEAARELVSSGALRIAVVGPSTADAVAELLGWPVALVPETYTGEGLLAAFDEVGGVAGANVFLPLAELARDVVPEGLRARGADVDRVVAYRTVPPDEADVALVLDALRRGEIDLLTFTSPSTAENLLELLGKGALRIPAAAIGPVTARAAEALGYRVVAVASAHTTDGLAEAVIRHLEEEARG